ncbi:MAG: ABC transporter ATP-binding protein [Pseudomonadota bacterium]|nr:ABC transporter ATP-binding protein [Pseudomonadota bacterium]
MVRTNEDIISLSQIALSLAGPDKKPTHILHDISLQVQAGSAISITGASGSGKTSLMMLIAGVEKPTSGKIIIANTDITHYDEDQLAAFRRRNISVVFQNFHLIPTMTAYENIEIALELAGFENCEQKARESLKSVGLEQRCDHYPDQLSGGEQQRVALARAFATQPKVLLADEPTGNLDSENGQQITELLFQLVDEFNTTLVLITHDPQLAAMTHRQLVMKDGVLHED